MSGPCQPCILYSKLRLTRAEMQEIDILSLVYIILTFRYVRAEIPIVDQVSLAYYIQNLD